MKNLKWLLILVVLFALVLSVAACGEEEAPTAEPTEKVVQAPEDTPVPPEDTPVPEPTDTPIPEPTDTPVPPTDTPVPPTDTPEPTEEPEDEQELDLSMLADRTAMTSYRSTIRIAMAGTAGGEEVDGALEFLMEFTSEPPAQHIVLSAEGLEGTEEFGDIEMYVVEDTMYIRLGEDWMSAPAEGDLGSEFDMFSSDEFLSDTCGWKNQGETELNGVQVQHWTVSKEDVEACLPAADLEELGDITALSGDLYIAVDGNYVARMDMVMEGSNMDMGLGLSDEEISEGRIEISIEFTDVNEPFTIEVPEEAMAGAGLPQDIPVPPDAGAVSSMFGMITFESPSTAQEVADFYQAEMPNNGWTETGADDMGAIFMLEYEKDGRTASFMISTDQDTGVTSVLITLSE